MEKILFVDVETGGKEPSENSLLSIGLVVWGDNKVLGEMELLIKHGTYSCTDTSLGINKIDLKNHDKIALPIGEVKEKLFEFLSNNFGTDEKITLAGQNIRFDISFLKEFLGKEYDKYFSYRSIDLHSIMTFLSRNKIIESSLKSLDDAIKYFGIKVNKRHTALEDARVAAEIYYKLSEISRPTKKKEEETVEIYKYGYLKEDTLVVEDSAGIQIGNYLVNVKISKTDGNNLKIVADKVYGDFIIDPYPFSNRGRLYISEKDIEWYLEKYENIEIHRTRFRKKPYIKSGFYKRKKLGSVNIELKDYKIIRNG